MYSSVNGIGLLVVRDFAHIPAVQDGRGLVLQVDENNAPCKLYYYDVLGRVELDPDSFDMRELEKISGEKEVSLSSFNPSLFYLSAAEINATLGVQADAIRGEKQIVTEYFRLYPNQDKLSRKQSALENSYVRDGENHVIALNSKDECRVVWQDSPPSLNLFKNLPKNTSAAYVVVPTDDTGKYDIYYIENQQDSRAEHVKSLTDLSAFRPFYLRNAAASKTDLENITGDTRHRHKSQAKNVLGAGAFGRVKHSSSMLDSSGRVTKTQILPKERAIKSKFDNRDARIRNAQQEAKTSADVHGGSDKILVIGDKAYMHMQPLGEPLSQVIPELDRAAKIDLAIKFLSAVAALHRGDTQTKTRYAHRDIKPANVLYNRDTGAVKLVDFGFSTTNIVDKGELNAGTLYYSALDQSVINEHLRLTTPSGFVADDPSSTTSVSNDGEKGSQYSEEVTSVHNFSSSLDSDDDSVHDFTDESQFATDDIATSEQKSHGSGIYIAPGKNLDWQNKLADKSLCLTENYLEDDKVASLRTVFCNPEPVKPGAVISIFTPEEFASFPEPIREVFDSTTIAPLLTTGRRNETLDFFSSVMIAYQANPNLSDREYYDLIGDLRQDHAFQARLQEQYSKCDEVDEDSFDTNDLTEALESTQEPRIFDGSTDFENSGLGSSVYLDRKIKPVAADDLAEYPEDKYKVKPSSVSKKGIFSTITNYFKKHRVSPTMTDDLSSLDEETDDCSRTKPKS